jgi:hypothetical protein
MQQFCDLNPCGAKTGSLLSSCFPIVEIEHAPEPFAALNRAIDCISRGTWLQQSVPYTLMIPLATKMQNILPQCPAKGCLPEKNHAIQAFAFY